MNEPAESLEQRIQDLDRVCRIGFLLVTLFFAWIVFSLALNGRTIGGIYDNMLAGKALPGLTQMAIGYTKLWMAISIVLPSINLVAMLRMRRLLHAVLVMVAGILILIFIATALWIGYWLPWSHITTGMNAM